MKKNLLFLVGCLLATATFNTALTQDKDQVVLTVENEKITLGDFEAVFKKNNRDSVISAQALDEYMELFINFKLKVREARELGLDTAASFKRELDGYRKQLARPYLIDGELLDELVNEAYERRKYEVNASHILVNVEPSASPEDTLRAWNRIMRLRERILSGEEFGTVATSKAGSDDPSVRENKGNLGYFTSFQMVYPFESAAYNTAVGDVSMPVRSRFGYHIVNTHDKRAARGEVRVAHIMIKHPDGSAGNPELEKESEARINEIHQLLIDGGDFADLALRYSQDASTARNGGELPWFGTGKMVEEFETASFNLPHNGAISEPVRTTYGWHIIMRLEAKPIPTFEEMEAEIRRKVSRDTRADMTKRSFLNKLRDLYGVNVNTKNLKPLETAAAKDDSTFVEGYGIQVKNVKSLDKPLFSIAEKNYLVSDFYHYLNNSNIRRRGYRALDLLKIKLDEYIEQELTRYEDTKLEEKHNDFRLLMSEYHDGILLFELTDQKVWSRAVRDTLGLESFYEENKHRFMWEDRASATIYTCATSKISKDVERMLKKGSTPAEVKEKHNRTSALNVRIEEGTWERGENSLLERADWSSGSFASFEQNGQFYVVQVVEFIPSRPKALDEARGMITAEYQNHLEQQWIAELRSKYNYSVNRQALHSLK